MPDSAAYVLYVARDKRDETRYDFGSLMCLRLLDRTEVPGGVHVKECDWRLTHQGPSWLTGTPTLYCASTGTVWRGHQALESLQVLGGKEASQKVEASGAVAAPPSAQDGAQSKCLKAHEPADPWGSGSTLLEEDESLYSTKVTADDLDKYMRSRKMQEPTGPEPPPIEPMKDS